jgi:4'-phosphopantetheinyl transferase EntD
VSFVFSHLKVPSFISVSSGPLLDDVPPLHDDELASTAPMSPDRLKEFSQGRWHARKALAQLGVAEASLPVSANRSPVWPKGFVGSISHVPANRQTNQPGQIVAVAAQSKDCSGLGVDLERTGMLMPEHWQAFLCTRELAYLGSRPWSQRDRWAHGLWSAKEAAMKAMMRPLDAKSMEVCVLSDGRSFVTHGCILQTCSSEDLGHLSGEITFEGMVQIGVTLYPRFNADG